MQAIGLWVVALIGCGMVAAAIHSADCPAGKVPVRGVLFFQCVQK